MTWRPLHANHAIERLRLITHFTEAVPAKVSRQMSDCITKNRSATRMTGPTPLTTTTIEVPAGPLPSGQVAPLTQQHVAQGWQFVRAASSGSPLEACIFDGNQLIYESVEYQRWNIAKRRYGSVLGEALAHASKSLDFASITMEYVDRFIYDGPAGEASPVELLPIVEQSLPDDPKSGKAFWHLHRGWFEDTPVGGSALINLNFNAQEGVLFGTSHRARSIHIVTSAEIRADRNDLSIERLDANLDLLHDLTKYHFKAAISEKYHKAIGIL
jgi:uncharacterized protein (TIGR04255 family)